MGTRSYRLCELADIVGGEVVGDGDVEIRGVAGIREAGPGEITFVANPRYAEFLAATRASAVIGGSDLSPVKPLIRIGNPYYAYLQVLSLFAADRAVRYARGVHERALVHPDAVLGADVAVGPFCQISAGARIGDRTTILAGTFVGEGCVIGSDCLIYPNVTIREGAEIGCRVILQPGVVLGSDGFGYAKNGSSHHKVPQIGRVVIEDDVEIGANSCVDRATTGETRIRRGTKIDNLVQIAHNVVIGEDSMLAAQVGISGSTEVGRNVVMGGQAGLAGHIEIGDRATIGAQAGVTKGVAADKVVSGYPARDHELAKRLYAHTAMLPALFERVRILEQRLRELEKGGVHDPAAKNDR
ncbi:MAG TPA: UDP-3-O-(3-hydroxymyristoyl)glucosamine N-acyltransferase [Candidatus Krumholzibacteria bacterium]|nr:UDP-3-O-(3-hydroxymyristoyl)glucosamine N-acyltransferase [Candidatus Krumholzibacteria bacterium]